LLDDELMEMEEAFAEFRKNPSFTAKKNLRMKNYGRWFIIEQNPERESPYAHLKNAGLFIAHIIDDDNDLFAGFTIKENIYVKPGMLSRFIDGDLLRRELTPYFEDMETKKFGGVKIDYAPDEKGNALAVQLNENNLHIGFRIDLIRELLL